MSEANNGHHPFTAENAAIAAPALRKPKRHNAKLCSLAIRQHIFNALVAGDSHRAIARSLRVSPNTVRAVAEEEWKRVEARKARIAAQSKRNATRAAELNRPMCYSAPFPQVLVKPSVSPAGKLA
jgi:DNA-binding NarL/FixJ family response regulator